jgi:chaperone modulatory protein CbpM
MATQGPLEGELGDRLVLTLRDLCVATGVKAELAIELVSIGVIQARGAGPDTWVFDLRALERSRRAVRLHHDLGIDWAGLALALDLLEELERLRERVELLERSRGPRG